MSRRLPWLLVLVAALSPAVAAAQAVHLDQYRAAETPEDGFAVSRPTDLGHLRFGARLDLDYAFNPLVYEDVRGDASTERASVVEHALAAQLGASVGLFDRLVVHVGLDVNLALTGEAVAGQPVADGTSLGDLRVAARGRLFGERDDPFALALQLTLTLPTAQGVSSGARFAGEDGVTVQPEVLAEVRPGAGIRIDANLGARLRATDRARFVDGGLEVGHELTWAIGVMVPVVERFELGAEVYGSTPFERAGDRASSPVEAIVGARVLPIDGLVLGLAGGLGLARGYGAPDFRGVLTVGWVDASTSGMREGLRETDEDGGAGRGVGVGGDDGADGSGSGGAGSGGAAGPGDRDRDGVPDDRDGAPDDPEDHDGFEDEDGVPDPDNDRDGVLDVDDGCPLAPGPAPEHGCPRTVRVDEASGRIYILQRVEFETNRAEILPESHEVLEEVRAVLASNPQLRVVRVEGHTDDRGRDAANLDLSTRRAQAVIAWLVEHGIARSRFTGVGCGEVHPIETNGTPEGRRSNRRVEFHIIDPAPEGGARQLEGCRDVE
ncbi:MAG: OmpA family protein [Sandaracinaceae bacterium]|nr:OmpA family protein [Sandaracinaceae bacterium]